MEGNLEFTEEESNLVTIPQIYMLKSIKAKLP